MDIQIERKKGLRILFAKRSLPYWGGMLFLLFAAWLLLRDNASTLRVDAGTLSVAEVTQGDFNDYIRVTGQVEPITTVQLSPLEAGVVERLVVEEGASVRRGDVLVGISTSGNSPNVLAALEAARKAGLHTLGFTGNGGGAMAPLCDILLDVPHAGTPLIQETHIAAGHLLCQLTDYYLFENVAALQPLLGTASTTEV